MTVSTKTEDDQKSKKILQKELRATTIKWDWSQVESMIEENIGLATEIMRKYLNKKSWMEAQRFIMLLLLGTSRQLSSLSKRIRSC
ncbi:hypothetical protein HanPI659440_Chr09g0322581 [Helianthus annuus]|nr:hypothetical protein HanPI659440_Chr09g0322581 [Helianthus annuus]